MSGYANINIGNAKMSNEGMRNVQNAAAPMQNTAQGYYSPSGQSGSAASTQLYNAGTPTQTNQALQNAGIKGVSIPPPPGNISTGPIDSHEPDWSKVPGHVTFSGGNKPPGWTAPPEWKGLDTSKLPPLMNPDGSDTEFGKLIKMGAPNDPNLRPRYDQLLNEWRVRNGIVTPPITTTPTVSPVPTAPASITGTPKPIGSTAPTGSLSTGQAGVQGQASPIQNTVTNALSFLQKGIPQVASQLFSAPSLVNIPQGVMDFVSSPMGQKITQEVQNLTSKIPIVSGKGLTGDPIHMGEEGRLNKALGNIPLPDIGVSELQQNIFGDPNIRSEHLGSFSGDRSREKTMKKSSLFPEWGWRENTPGDLLADLTGRNMLRSGEVKGVNTGPKDGGQAPFQFSQPTMSGNNIQWAPSAQPQQQTASMANMAGSLQGPQADQAINAVIGGFEKADRVAPAIANYQSLPAIDKAINTAMKSNDTAAVRRGLDLKEAVTDQLNLITRIGQAVASIAQGFGSPQSGELTGARMPLVEQGIGKALTEAPPISYAASYQQPGMQAPVMPTRLPEVSQTQRNKPVFPGGGR